MLRAVAVSSQSTLPASLLRATVGAAPRAKVGRQRCLLCRSQPAFVPAVRSFAASVAIRAPVDHAETPTSGSKYTTSNLSDEEYHSVANATMETLTDYLESMVEDGGPQTRGCDVEFSSGVLTLNMAGYGIYVVNLQPPNKQLWLSSPISGPKRYDYDAKHKVWFNPRDSELLETLLNQELKPMVEADVNISLKLDE